MYKFKRVDKIPEPASHHMAAGNIVHSSYYMAYGFPSISYDPASKYTNLKWDVDTVTPFRADDALAIFNALWWRDPETNMPAGSVYDKLPPNEKLNPDLQNAFLLLSEDVPYVKNFRPGKVKALKVKGQEPLKEAWYYHFKDMLKSSLVPLAHPVIEIERKVDFTLGDYPAIGFIDLVLDSPDGEIFVDLKTGYNKPNDNQLIFDDQIASYYIAGNPHTFWLYHMRSNEIMQIDRNEYLISNLHEMANQDALSIEHEFFPKAYDKEKCSYCAYRRVCIGA